MTHHFPVRIYYEDTDFSGNVYHAAYLKFFERGRTEFLRDLGVHHAELAAQGLAFAVRSMTIEFEGAAHIDDLLTVTTGVVKVSGARLVLEQTIGRGETVLTRAAVVVAAIKTTGGPARLPAALRDLLTGQG
ncbi:tol-pal system-associated acyl-CoA thioesterase [Devosia beringensis]|uniref:tol-pal system-associated acyl-CoA thioesterase n=1 Tax=Devosia beringensis TaxID=2657486 RepID=UPI00186B5FB0|nr:tol-pal system-associated acyl-CoA thioesterase [Devosia beringensis]